MKIFKLWVHQKGFSEDDLAINPKEFPNVKIGDILEIYHPDEEESSRLLLQVKSFKEDFQQKEIISIDQSIANQFQLRAYKEVNVTCIDPQDVALDLVELAFKDQYISRSDMWRLRQNMVGACVYIGKTIEFSGIRAQVSELWSRGERVMCGAINEDTRVAFRSSTAMVYMFLQMSSEMWDFDCNGDLYFEKAVNGFLTDLFTRWIEKKSYNEVTMVLFSRTYYHEVKAVDEFPENVRESIHVDYQGRVFQDFYRVIVQNERRDDWLPLLVTLKSNFISYPEQVLYVKTTDGRVIKGYNSTAAEGNCLEALNLALNVFDKHYINRNFDRTGQLVTIITPGAGVFEVDRNMCKITKQRMIDNGIGSDLVCMAEQPLHAVPLFRFHKTEDTQLLGDDYNIPHWLNHSYYTNKRQIKNYTSNFSSRINLAERQYNSEQEPMPKLNWSVPHTSSNQLIPQLDDYIFEEYDANIFKTSMLPKPRTASSIRPTRSTQSTPYRDHSIKFDTETPRKARSAMQPCDIPIQKKSTVPVGTPTSSAIPIPTRKHAATVTGATRIQTEVSIDDTAKTLSHSLDTACADDDHKLNNQPVTVGSAGAVHDCVATSPRQHHVKRALINPFAASSQMVRLTSSRRRWTHTFPHGPTGEIVQFHHRNRRSNLDNSIDEDQPSGPAEGAFSPDHFAHPMGALAMRPSASTSSLASDSSGGNRSSMGAFLRPSNFSLHQDQSNNLLGRSASPQDGRGHRPLESRTSWVWGMTGEQEWSPFLQTGVDWKSLTATACFPMSTDYFPDNYHLDQEFVESFYELLPDEEARGNQRQTVEGTFHELLSQRLCQGFQLVLVPESVLSSLHRWRGRQFLVSRPRNNEYILSLGRMFHKLTLRHDQSTILVTMYKPRHPYACLEKEYSYQLWSSHNTSYQPCKVHFQTQALEHFNWNYLDNYISSRGVDFGLMESLKYWRSRFLLLPSQMTVIKKLAEDGNEHCDVFSEQTTEEVACLVEGFLRVVETLNRIRRPIAAIRRAKKIYQQRLKAEGINIKPNSQPIWHQQIEELDLRGSKNGSKWKQAVHATLLQRRRTAGNIEIEEDSESDLKLKRAMHASLSQRRKTTGNILLEERNYKHVGPTSRITPAKISFGSTSGRSTPPIQLLEGSRSRSSSDADTKVDTKMIDVAEDKLVLTLTSPIWEMARAMADTNDGLVFLPTDIRNLPANCFVASEAVSWIMSTLQGEVLECDALEILQNMVEQDFVCHASGNPKLPFLNGFYLYVLNADHVSKEIPNPKQTLFSYSLLEHFQEEWIEITIPNTCEKQTSIPTFFCPHLMAASDEDDDVMPSPTWALRKDSQMSTKDFVLPNCKNVIMDMTGSKSDRTEWCHVNYESAYTPSHALELQLEWLVATPSLLLEMLQAWTRKVAQCGFHLIPAPIDPFNRSIDCHNPISQPRAIPLCVNHLLEEPDHHLFEQFDRRTRNKRLYLFQEAILKKFGFIPARDSSQLALVRCMSYEGQCEYVHVSGTAFVYIDGLANQDRQPCRQPSSPFPQLHLANHGNHSNHGASSDSRTQAGVYFMWVYNYMLTKRWRTSAAGDERLHDKLLADFIKFCNNEDGRLRAYWEELQESAMMETCQKDSSEMDCNQGM